MNNIDEKIKHIQASLKELNIKVDTDKVLNRTDQRSILGEPELLVVSSASQNNYLPSTKFSVGKIISFVKEMYKIMLAVPVIIFIALYLKKPAILMKKDKKTGKTVFDPTRFKVSLGLSTLICYVGLYMYHQKFSRN